MTRRNPKGTTQLHQQMADIFNQIFERGEDLKLTCGTLIMPGKPPCLLSSLRPIALLNTLRKSLPRITLNRIRPAVERFLSPNQSGFRQNRPRSFQPLRDQHQCTTRRLTQSSSPSSCINILTKYIYLQNLLRDSVNACNFSKLLQYISQNVHLLRMLIYFDYLL